MKHPLNWLIVGLMLLVAAVGGQLVLAYFGAQPASAEQPGSGGGAPYVVKAGPTRKQLADLVLQG